MSDGGRHRLCLWLLLLMATVGVVRAADSTIAGTTRIRDTYIQDRLGGGDNYGGATSMFVGWNDNWYAQSRRRIFLWFDLPHDIDTVAACTLSLYLTSINGADPDTVDVFWCTRDAAAYEGDNTAGGDAEDGEMSWLNYFDDDDGIDSAWSTAGGDIDTLDALGDFVWDGAEADNQWYRLALNKTQIDSLLQGAGDRSDNFGVFLVSRIDRRWPAYGRGVTEIAVATSESGNGPQVTFYDVGASAITATHSARRRRAALAAGR